MNPSYFVFCIATLIGALALAYSFATRETSTYRFYSAAGRLSGFQNGLAMAGDFISAASFLGVTGTIALYGSDGILYAVGFLLSYALLWLVARPVHKLGRYTLAEVVSTRFPSRFVRLLTALNTMIICLWYMVPQLVAAGLLVRLLLNVNYTVAVLITGLMMTVYVIFGGMVSTSWVQIMKTILLVACVVFLTLIVLARLHWNVMEGMDAAKMNHPFSQPFFEFGHLLKTPLDRFSVLLSLLLGTAGLPHILVRFFTVRNVRAVYQSLLTATGVLAVFYVLALVLGVAAVALMGWDHLRTVDPTGNMVVPLLAGAVGGDFMTAFVSAVAFATILAVVTGLLLTATGALSHDLLHRVLRQGAENEKNQLRTAKLTAVAICALSVVLSLCTVHTNVTIPITLIFVVAAATNLPLLIFTFYWNRFTSAGAVTGILTGLLSSAVLTLLNGHSFQLPLGFPTIPGIPLDDIGLIAIPCGFLGSIVGTWCSRQSDADKQRFQWLVQKTRSRDSNVDLSLGMREL